MPKNAMLSTRKPYGIFAFWGLHTLMLALFLILEAVGFKMPVGSSVFYFTWIALWIMHGLTLLLIHMRDREIAADDWAAGGRFWRRMILGLHGAFYVAYGPAVLLWWLTARQPGPQQPGEGQGLWIYPIWLMLLLAHGIYVMMRERQVAPAKRIEKRKRDTPSLERLMEANSDEVSQWDNQDDDHYETKNKR